ncbi:hypothetical protein K402DRAFT_135221 [Aulographum hederae CBS 113979]|uniref:Uncharacterized protein n=1 Tax=Aulographum hederae CBS 113979 TaxID=1176131 RepID=A0A6G1GUZ0_9PEZI|nr:hypothetical protein K402DRAFT_135221 [Aulographum hederae CBS 113979]
MRASVEWAATAGVMAVQQSDFFLIDHHARLPSPTLTNPDMILPSVPRQRTPPLQSQTPPSPSNVLRKVTSEPHFENSDTSWSTSLPRRPSSGLSDIDELETTPKKSDFMTMSTLKDAPQQTYWSGNEAEKRWSSSSVDSADLESLKWPGFQSLRSHANGNSGVNDEEEQRLGRYGDDDDSDTEQWGGRSQEDDAAMSLRADMILANAKKRLTLMEGNLRGAKNSLNRNSIALSSSNSLRRSVVPPLPINTSDGYVAPRRQRSFGSSPLSAPGVHSRGYSDNSIADSVQSNRYSVSGPPVRRANSVLEGGFSPFDRTGTIRGSRSQEVMRENHRDSRVMSWVSNGSSPLLDNASVSSWNSTKSHSPRERTSFIATGNNVTVHRASTTTDLRGQMNDLKGRISSLQQRARDEEKRRSLQPSISTNPFTSTDNGVDWEGVVPRKRDSFPRKNSIGSVNSAASTTYEESRYEDAAESLSEANPPEQENARKGKDMGIVPIPEEEETSSDDENDSDPQSPRDDVGEPYPEDVNPSIESISHENRPDAFDYENFFLHSAMGTYSQLQRRGSVSSEDSVETAVPDNTLKDSDADADTDADADVDTEADGEDIAVSPSEVPRPWLKRNHHASTESISSTATFATAHEGLESSDDEDGDDDSEYNEPQHHMYSTSSPPSSPPTHTPRTVKWPLSPTMTDFTTSSSSSPSALLSPRADSAVVMHTTASKPSHAPTTPPTNTSSNSGRSTPRKFHHPSDIQTRDLQRAPAHADNNESPPASASFDGLSISLNDEDTVLVHALATSLQQLCLSLQGSEGGSEERAVLRRRLVEARGVLDGES